ncbi:hypothetical protein GCM10007094_00330 [Pseudovibrio japonicus]|uniref:Uncharacterized protein n=1 Tax=Pseudovibrio japonicus TaxID=366534 RepID=A0ABQ3DVR6_9HYPH|nr:hypothetical protein GCM10007094_00330 [Pseudovibrio japonicus]
MRGIVVFNYDVGKNVGITALPPWKLNTKKMSSGTVRTIAPDQPGGFGSAFTTIWISETHPNGGGVLL